MSTSICVVGSINMDLVVSSPEFPRPGETVLGGEFHVHPGGKGANQAVAAGRLGAAVSLCGCVGEDAWGSELRGVLTSEGVDLTALRALGGVDTAVGVICVVPGGENSIVVAPGANGRVQPEHVEEAHQSIVEADALILQGEIPDEANQRAVEIAAAGETRVVLNAAPARSYPTPLLERVDLLIANEAEGRALARCEEDVSHSGVARRLGALGPNRVAVTLGAAGAVYFDGERIQEAPPFPVEALDTVGAGDAFVAAMVVAQAEGMRAVEALRFACAAGALATRTPGALESMPRRQDVDALVAGGPSADERKPEGASPRLPRA